MGWGEQERYTHKQNTEAERQRADLLATPHTPGVPAVRREWGPRPDGQPDGLRQIMNNRARANRRAPAPKPTATPSSSTSFTAPPTALPASPIMHHMARHRRIGKHCHPRCSNTAGSPSFSAHRRPVDPMPQVPPRRRSTGNLADTQQLRICA